MPTLVISYSDITVYIYNIFYADTVTNTKIAPIPLLLYWYRDYNT